MYGALRSLPAVPFAPAPSPVEELTGCARRSAAAAPVRQAGRRVGICVRREQGAEDAVRRGAGTKLWRRHADHHRRRAIEPRPCDGRSRGKAGHEVHPGGERYPSRNARPPTRCSIRSSAPRFATSQSRDERAPAMEAAADQVRQAGGNPFVIPLGASTPLGAAGFVDAIAELAGQIDPPDVIVHATSSGGTQAGLVAGCSLAGWPDPRHRHQCRRIIGGAGAGRPRSPGRGCRPSRVRSTALRLGDGDGGRSVRGRRLRRADA